ncbi:F0F1 ATP synthase subunit B family protein [Terrihabitans sp. B22-R8]|uniref:F0F1 ATP synthase subunit B family protein n=1 Tax=Terrihabitans sp. B22-R8 TaxID=3425128 RepID=UPI00403C5278
MLMTAEFWVLAAFIIFIVLMMYVGVHKKIIGSLDARSKRIADDIDEARRLREEAQRVLAEYERKRLDAENEAEAIVASARTEAQRIADEAKTKAEDFVARRTKMAEVKIAQAEVQALAEVRAVAADAATAAAATILQSKTAGAAGDELLQRGLQEVRTKLH